jgi:hypothetical protein
MIARLNQTLLADDYRPNASGFRVKRLEAGSACGYVV